MILSYGSPVVIDQPCRHMIKACERFLEEVNKKQPEGKINLEFTIGLLQDQEGMQLGNRDIIHTDSNRFEAPVYINIGKNGSSESIFVVYGPRGKADEVYRVGIVTESPSKKERHKFGKVNLDWARVFDYLPKFVKG
jgi:hypothetical protein